MTRAPFVQAKAAEPWSRRAEIYDTTIGWRFVNPKLAELHYPYSMDETAENVAERWGISREEQDAFAVASQQKAAAAQVAGRFRSEIVPVAVPGRKGEAVHVEADEHPRHDTTLDK